MDPSDTDTPIFVGHFPAPVPISQFAQVLQERLAREPMVIGEQAVSSVAWCTGAGQGYIDAAADWGADVFVTGRFQSKPSTLRESEVSGLSLLATMLPSAMVCRQSVNGLPMGSVFPMSSSMSPTQLSAPLARYLLIPCGGIPYT